MITADPAEFLARLGALESDPSRALPRGVLMVMPEQFYVEPETAADNVYLDLRDRADPVLASQQAQDLAVLIESIGIPVRRFPGRPDQPDGVFSNNVFATAPGRAVVGHMAFASRQPETRRTDIRDWLIAQGYALADLSGMECIAELTGPLIIDRARNVGLCGMSGRVDEAGLVAMHEALGLALTYRFDLVPGEYHTNVVLSVLAGRACLFDPSAFADRSVPATLLRAFDGRCISITPAEKQGFVGNCIALTDRDLFMSARAEQALSAGSRQSLEALGFTIHSTDLSELERAGGSLRCMVTELF
jgi:hypothetical protein